MLGAAVHGALTNGDRHVWSSAVRTFRFVVLTWFRLFATAFGTALMFSSLVSLSTDKAFCLLYALAEVVATTAVHTHPAFSSFPEPLCLVAPATKGKSLRQDGVCCLLAFHSQD